MTKHPALLQGVRIIFYIQLSLKFKHHAGFTSKDKLVIKNRNHLDKPFYHLLIILRNTVYLCL